MKSNLRLQLLLPMTVLATAASSMASTGTAQIRVLPTLGKELIEGTLGTPTPSGDASIHLPIGLVPKVGAPPLIVKNVSLAKAPEDVKLYGEKVFGLRFDQSFELGLQLFGLALDGDLRVQSVQFSPFIPEGEKQADDEHLNVDLVLELRNVSVSAERIWAKEIGLTRGSSIPNGCPNKKNPITQFAGNQVWADVTNVSLTPKNAKESTRPLLVKARFVVSKNAETSKGERVEPRLASLTHNATEILLPHYRLNAGGIEVPTVWFRVKNEATGKFECFEGDSSGVKPIFQSLFPKIQAAVVNGVSKSLAKIVMKAAMRALSRIEIPAGAEFSREFKSDRNFWLERPLFEPARIDRTAVAKPAVLLSTTPEPAPSSAFAKAFASIPWEIQQRLSLDAFHVGSDGALELSLSTDLSVNRQSESKHQLFEAGNLPLQDPRHIRLVLNRSFFESKADLIDSLRDEQAQLLPEAIRLIPGSLRMQPRKDGRASFVGSVEIQLGKIAGLAAQAASLIENLSGSTGGTVRIPLIVDLEPKILNKGGSRQLQISLNIPDDFENHLFSRESNLNDLSPAFHQLMKIPRVAKILRRKLQKTRESFEKRPVEIDLAPIEEKSPFRFERVTFSDSGALALDLSLHDLRKFVKKNDRCAEEMSHD